MMTLIDDVSLGYWLADYYVLATIVLLVVGVALARLRQPSRRLSVSWSALVGLAALAVVSALPSWPRAGWPSRPGPSTTPRTLLSSSTASGPAGSPLSRPIGPAVVRPDPRTEVSTIDGGRPPEVATRERRGAPTEAKMGAWPPFASRAFLAGGAVMLAWLGIGSWQTASLRRRARQAPDWSRDVLARVVGDGTAAPRLLTCDRLHQPVAVGLLRPTVILPDRFLEDEPGPRLEAVLAHEWAHIRNRDLWLIALSRLLMPILFAHPAYWWLRRRIRDDQEILADAHAATVDGRVEYAEILLSWASGASERSWAAIGGSLALWERPSQLKRRIIMLLDRDFRVETTCPRHWLLGVRGGTALAILGISLLTLRPTAAGADGPAKADRPAEAAKAEVKAQVADEPDDSARLFDPDGKPFSGAKVYLSGARDGRSKPRTATLLGTTGPGGSFRLPKQTEADRRAGIQVVATAGGYGPAFAVTSAPGVANGWKLVKDDVPIRGRVLDIQGRPVAGAWAQVVAVFRHPGGRLDAWLARLEAEGAAFSVQNEVLTWWATDDVASFYPPVAADGDGRFTLRGIGRERVAALLIGGPGVETRMEYVATRRMPAIKYPDFDGQNFSHDVVYHGADFDLVLGPGLEAVGTVTDKDSGKPLDGATVETAAMFGNPLRTLNTTTDAQGRYRLTGIPPRTHFNDGQELLVRIKDGLPYLPAAKPLGNGDGMNPILLDFQLRRGVRAKGRVVDKSTGKGVHAGLEYYILQDNPYLKTYSTYGTRRVTMSDATDDDGNFELLVMPGPGVIAARAGNEHYRMGVGVDTIEGLKWSSEDHFVAATVPTLLAPTNYHTVVGINPKEGDESVACEIALDRGRAVNGKVVGPDGEPLAGARIEGLQDRIRTWSREPLPSAEFLVEGIGRGSSRDLLVYHDEKKLAGAYVIGADEGGPITVKLELCGTVTGRLVDAGGMPLAEVEMTCNIPFRDPKHESGSLPAPVKSGRDGRFRAEGLVPGRKYTFEVWKGNVVANVAKDIVVTRGESRVLGDVTLDANE